VDYLTEFTVEVEAVGRALFQDWNQVECSDRATRFWVFRWPIHRKVLLQDLEEATRPLTVPEIVEFRWVQVGIAFRFPLLGKALAALSSFDEGCRNVGLSSLALCHNHARFLNDLLCVYLEQIRSGEPLWTFSLEMIQRLILY
jgi:hypothetical protein